MKDFEAVDLLHRELEDYLRSHGIKASSGNMFSCISPEHDDSSPSCHIVPATDGRVFKCFGCGFSGNIFTAAWLLEGLPREGELFWKKTLPELAKRYDLKYEEVELTSEEKELLAKKAAYSDAAAIICRPTSENLPKFLKDRGWSMDTAKMLSIGAIDNVEEYVISMAKLGWTKPFMKKIGLLDNGLPPFIFNAHSLIFCIRNVNTEVVAFAGRDMNWKEGDTNPKYYNSSNSDIYEKHTLVYNLHNAKRKDGTLVLVEGYADVAGLVNANPSIRVGAICGTRLYPEQIAALSRVSVANIELALDGDKEGKKAVTGALDELAASKAGFFVKVVPVPDDKDPGEIATEFKDIVRQSPFEWSLLRAKETTNLSPEEIAQQSTSSIMLVPDRIERHRMAKELAAVTSVPLQTILSEIERRDDVQGTKKREKEDAIRSNVIEALKKGKDLREIVDRAEILLQTVEEEFSTSDIIAEDVYAAEVRKLWGQTESGENMSSRLHLSSMSKSNKWLDGFPTTSCMILLGGIPHCGKSSWLRAMTWDLARSNQNLTVIYHNVDEPRKRMVTPLVAMQAGLPISSVAHYRMNTIEEQSAIKTSYAMVEQFAREGRYVILDARAGASLDSVERIVTNYQDKYPERKVVYVFDNFHKLTDYPTSDRYTKYTACSKHAQSLILKHDFPMIMTVELRKIDTRTGQRRIGMTGEPRPEDMKETGSLYYDADVVWLAHNDLHVNPNTRHFWTKTTEGSSMYGGDYAYRDKLPVLDIAWWKNREAGMMGKIHFKYEPLKNSFQEVDRLPRRPDQTSEEDLDSLPLDGSTELFRGDS